MTKIVYNACFGGFDLSHEAIMRYAEIKGMTLYLKEESVLGHHYYLCPPDEFDRIYAEELAKPVSPDRFESSNRLYFSVRDIERNDPALVQVVEEMGEAANGSHAKLQITKVPTGTLYRIDAYDGREYVETRDGYDWKVA